MTEDEKLNLVTNWFAEDWAIESAMGLLGDYEKMLEAQQPAARAPADSVLEDAARWRFAEANITYADLRGGGYVNTIGFPEKASKEAVREVIDAARKQGTSHD